MAYIDQFVLNEGLSCDAEIIPGDTVPTRTSMIGKGQPDVTPEMWTEDGEEGFWVPDYLVKLLKKQRISVTSFSLTLLYSLFDGVF